MSKGYCGYCGDGHDDLNCPYVDWGSGRSMTIEDECASRGHAYYGDEADPAEAPPEALPILGRCYCGERRYPAGGPAQEAAS